MSGIFISYRHKGGFPTANHLEEKLKKDYYNVYFDRSSKEPGKFGERIKSQIDKCTDFIVVLDKDVFSRTLKNEPREDDGVRLELSYAKERGKNIIPVLLPEFEWQNGLPDDIKGLQEYNHPNYSEEHFDGFYKDLTSFIISKPAKKHIKHITLFLLIIGLLSWLFYTSPWKKEPTLLLVGAGSLKGFFENKKDHPIPISTSKEWVYIPTSTGAALPIISKEIDVKQNNGNDKSRQYNLVVFSAINAKDTDFISDSTTRDKFITNIGHVIGVKIGSNDLRIRLKKDNYLMNYLDNDTITPKVLANIVQDTNVTVFTTSNNRGNRGVSGTFERYKEILKTHHVNLDSIHCEEFNLNQTYGSFNKGKNHFVILETTTFMADSTDTSDHWLTRPLYDSAKQSILQNDLYIYFVAHRKPESPENKYYVPKQVREFLKKAGDSLPDDEKITILNENELIQEYNMDGTIVEEK